MSRKIKNGVNKRFFILKNFSPASKLLLPKKELPEKYRDHALTGNFKGYRDCHVKPDLVLVYKLHDDEIELHHLKTHSELFG